MMKQVGLFFLAVTSVFAQDIHVLPVQGNVYMLVGAGGNIAASIGPDGILLVDAGTSQMSAKVLSTVLKLVTAVAASPRRIAVPACTVRRVRIAGRVRL